MLFQIDIAPISTFNEYVHITLCRWKILDVGLEFPYPCISNKNHLAFHVGLEIDLSQRHKFTATPSFTSLTA